MHVRTLNLSQEGRFRHKLNVSDIAKLTNENGALYQCHIIETRMDRTGYSLAQILRLFELQISQRGIPAIIMVTGT